MLQIEASFFPPKNQFLKIHLPTSTMGYSKNMYKDGWFKSSNTVKYLKNYFLKNRWWQIGNILLNATKI